MNKRFRFISYWGTWRRWLGERVVGGSKMIYEVELTPTNPEDDRSWQNMGIRIFAGPEPKIERGDRVFHQLPTKTVIQMCEKLGVDRARELLMKNFFSQLDFEKVKQHANNGGADFEDVKRIAEEAPVVMEYEAPHEYEHEDRA